MILPEKRIILSLDVSNLKEALKLVEALGDEIDIFKVGFQLFTKEGPTIIKEIHKRKKKVFLDLKFFDIPQTVANATIQMVELGVFMFNLHILGGDEMLKAAKEMVEKKSKELNKIPPLILGVTLLTSINQRMLKKLFKTEENIFKMVVHLAKLAKQVGLAGVVASAHEAKLIRQHCGNNFLIITPGIRLKESSFDDQKRITTPYQAIQSGSDYLVIGRPILEVTDKKKIIKKILKEIKNEKGANS